MILGILGSGSSESLTRQGLVAIEKQILAAGSQFDVIDLRSDFRSFHDLEEYANPTPNSQTSLFRAKVAKARAVILATPVYHGSFSGLLKNALDHLKGDSFNGLPVGILAAGGGPRSASVACEQLRSVVRALSGWSTPTHISMTYGDIIDAKPTPDLSGRIADMINEIESFRFLDNAKSNRQAG
jgi:azobenzene reductase